MSHKLTSNQSVTYNSELQLSGVLQIIPQEITYQHDVNSHNVLISCPIIVSESTSNYVGGLNYILTENDWNIFFDSQSLTSTKEFDKQEEATLKYVLTQIDGNWGLSSDDWIYSS